MGEPQTPLARPAVLVVDDEEAMCDSCRQVLDRAGYDVLTASNGRDGLSLLASRSPDVVIVDLKMPGMSGNEFLLKARDMDPLLVPVVITGYATLSSAVDAMKAGAYDFLPKPFERDELTIVTQRALEKRRLARAALGAERERMRMRDHFVAMVSHQLKSPLASLKECLDAALASAGGETDAKCRELVGRASRRAGHLIDLLDDWLTLARMESPGLMASAKPVDISTVVREAVERARDGLQWHDVDVECSTCEGELLVNGDADALRELFVNLVDNAIRYTPDGGKVRVEVKSQDAGAAVVVSDNGPGIPQKDLPLVFERFYRGEEAKKTDGTGLGLAIAKQIVEAHAGNISVTSKEGEGTAFKVRLPAWGES